MRHVEKYDNGYKVLGRWALDLVLFGLLIVACLAFLANCTGTGTPGSPPSTGRLDLGIVSGALFAQEFDVDSSGSERWACCFVKQTPQGPEWRCEPETEDVCAQRLQSTWSEGLTCDQVSCPPVDLGSCCFDCEPGSGGDDSCEDETTEPWCDEAGGRWEVNTLCGERLDCQDQCPVPRGSCCVGCVDGSGNHDECEDGIVEESCSGLGGSWLEDVECTQRDDCNGFCPEPVGAVCKPTASPPDEGAGGQCVEGISLAQCIEDFDADHCAIFWQLGETCATINCPDPVPTMPWWGYALLPAVLACCAAWLMRRSLKHGRWLPR